MIINNTRGHIIIVMYDDTICYYEKPTENVRQAKSRVANVEIITLCLTKLTINTY